MSVVSAENVTDTSKTVIEDNTNQVDVSYNTEINKKIVNPTKSSTSKTTSKIVVESQTVKFNTTTTLNAKVMDSKDKSINEGKVVFKVNGNTVGITNVNNGVASITFLADMTPKTYTLTAKYGETSNYLGSSSTATLNLLKHNSQITVNNVNVITRNKFKLTANVIDSESGNKATGGNVAFKLNGKTWGYANVTNGVASYSCDATKLSAKLYDITASYGGNHLLNSDVSNKAVLNVSAIPTRMSVNKVTGYSNSVVLKATVVEKSNSKYVPTGIVVFKINDKTVGNTTLTNGKAAMSYNTTQLARGTYKISAMLKPTSTYAYSEAENNLTILAEDYFAFSQIKNAAVKVRTEFEANNSVSTVHIGKSRIALSEFLALMIQATKNLYKGSSSTKVAYNEYKTITKQTDSIDVTGVLGISEIVKMGDNVLSYMHKHGKPPLYASTRFGKLGYFNIVYTYSKVLDVSTSEYVVSTSRVYEWNLIHPPNPKSRTIYITSDVVYNSKKDKAYMNKIKSKLKSLGYNVKIGGYGPNSHCSAIWDEILPVNSVQLSIFSGADAGVIYDVSTRSFMRTKANRLMFFVYYSDTSRDITGLKFLERAHDDNYSPSSFKGIAYPDIYLKEHGYDYVYTTNVNTIVNSLIGYIS